METFPGVSSEGNRLAPTPSSSNCTQDDVTKIENDKASGMETVQTVEKENSEDNGREIMENCLGLPTILRRILEQFSNKELIDLSLVNKLWNFEARSVLRDRGCLRARIDGRSLDRNLVDLAADLQQMRVVPFTGIRVDIHRFGSSRDACQSAPVGSLHPSYQIILDRLPWKHLSVSFSGNFEDFNECPVVLLVQKILEDNCGLLEEVSTFTQDSGSMEFVQTIFQGRSFPSLKTLKVGSFYGDGPMLTTFAKALVSAAPNLERLCPTSPKLFVDNILEGRSTVLWVDEFRPLDEEVCESLIGALRTEKMFIEYHGRRIQVQERLNRFVPMVMQASRTTIKTLTMNFLFAVPLMCYGICLENVTQLWIYTNYGINRIVPEHILELVKALDFTRVFPKLNTVIIRDCDAMGIMSDVISAFVERGNAMLREALPDRAMNIKHLKLYNICSVPGSPTIPMVAQIFPYVEAISVVIEYWQDFPFTLLWEHFEGVQGLHVHFIQTYSRIPNLDSAFCGIFPEEVAELRTKDDDFLKYVNIVPVMPSIGCMRGLQLLIMRYSPIAANTGENATAAFSKVTDFIGFSRCPALSVQFRTTPR